MIEEELIDIMLSKYKFQVNGVLQNVNIPLKLTRFLNKVRNHKVIIDPSQHEFRVPKAIKRKILLENKNEKLNMKTIGLLTQPQQF